MIGGGCVWKPMKLILSSSSSSSSSSSCARSVADIGDHGLPILSVVSSPDELFVGRFFSCYESFHSIFAFQVHQLCLYAQNGCCLFLVVLNRVILYSTISITSSFDFFSAHDNLIILMIVNICVHQYV